MKQSESVYRMAIDAIHAGMRAIDADSIRDGMVWYRNAQRESIHAFNAAGLTYPDPVVLGCVSACSPRTPWHRNVATAIRACMHRNGYMMIGIQKCMQIVACDGSVDTVASILLGKRKDAWKTHAFFRNLSGDLDRYVTIDGHMQWILSGEWMQGYRQSIGDNGKQSPNASSYQMMSQALIDASVCYGMRPAQLQACLWV